MIWLVLAVLVLAPIIGGEFLRRGRARSLEKMSLKVFGEITRRLEAIAGTAEGYVVEAHILETKDGRLSLAASGAPKSWVIDACEFTAQVVSSHRLTVVQAKDEAKVLRTRGFQGVTMGDAISSTHRVFATDEAFARAVVTAELVAALRTMDAAARLRTRLDLHPTGLTLGASRAPEKQEELLAFYQGCVAVLALLRPHLSLSPAVPPPAA